MQRWVRAYFGTSKCLPSIRLRHLCMLHVRLQENHSFPLLGFKIVVDAGNGAGGFFADEVCADGWDLCGLEMVLTIILQHCGSYPKGSLGCCGQYLMPASSLCLPGPPQVLAPLGADTQASQYLEPDGSFPNHIPNPEHPSAMAAGSRAVGEGGGG
jgi:hypothetical protein